MRYFFYGTLLDPDVRRFVLGASAVSDGLPARLDGFRRTCLSGATVPALVVGGGSVHGQVFDNIGVEQRRRLIAFEGADYREVEHALTIEPEKIARARFFVPRRILQFTADWSLEEWRKNDKPAFLRRIRSNTVRRRLTI